MTEEERQTIKLSHDESAEELARAARKQQAHQLALVIYHPDGVQSIPLVSVNMSSARNKSR